MKRKDCALVVVSLILATAILPAGTVHAQAPVLFPERMIIPTQGPSDWEFFTIGGDAYLAVASYYNGSHSTNSKIYHWDGKSFVEFQSIPTSDAANWEFFTIGTEAYLAVANYYNGTSYNINSKIYRWNGTSFAEIQSVPTSGAMDWEFFTIGGNSYLAVANCHNLDFIHFGYIC